VAPERANIIDLAELARAFWIDGRRRAATTPGSAFHRSSAMTALTSLGHVALRTRDIDRALAFYTGKLGMQEMMRLLYDDGSVFIVYLKITDNQLLELFPDGSGDEAPGPGAVGVNHFCLTVHDIERAVADLRAAGVPLWRDIKTGLDNNRQAWVVDPDGNRIELMEISPDCLQFQALRGLAEGKPASRHVTPQKRPVPAA
jgi:lactoylglutathione lyase